MVSFFCTCIAVLVAVKLYNKMTMGIYKGKEKLNGKTVIVTGANSGIGLESAKDLAQRGAKVVMVCRNIEKAEKVKEQIIKETGNSNIFIKHIDFASLDSVRKCAKEILEEEEKIDILLNNAGATMLCCRRIKTSDGLDILMQTNHFGPFLFTNILLDKIKKSAPCRIVNVASVLHILAKVNFKDFKTPAHWVNLKTYNLTKLANIYFTKELAMKLQGTGVTVNTLHPGFIASDIVRDLPNFCRFLYNTVFTALFKVSKDGAQTSLYACLSPEVANITGEYFSDCKIWKSPHIFDMGVAKKLWDISEDAVKLQPNETHY